MPDIVVKPVSEGSYLFWCCLPLISDDEAQSIIDQHFDSPFDSGAGGQFVKRATVRHSHSRTLITQFSGMDI